MSIDRTSAPPTGQFTNIRISEEVVEVMSNGIELHYINFGDQDVSQLVLIWEGGGFDVDRTYTTILLTQSLIESTQNLTATKLAEQLDFLGARISNVQSAHHSGLKLTVMNQSFKKSLNILEDIIKYPNFDTATINMLIRKASARRAIDEKEVGYISGLKLHKMLCGKDHPAYHSETAESINNITVEELQDTHKKTIARGRVKAFLSGCFSDVELNLVRGFLNTLPTPQCESPIRPIVAYMPDSPAIIVEAKPDAIQSSISMGMPSISRSHPDYIDLTFAVDALGGYFSSRLMQNIREKRGLTYGISSNISSLAEGTNIYIEAQCDAANVEEVIFETRREMENLALNPPCGDELRRLKFNTWTALARVAESSIRSSTYYINQLLFSRPNDYFKSQMTALDSLTSDKLSEIASLYLIPDNLRIVVAGAHTKINI